MASESIRDWKRSDSWRVTHPAPSRASTIAGISRQAMIW
jgi:hypothetical protein